MEKISKKEKIIISTIAIFIVLVVGIGILLLSIRDKEPTDAKFLIYEVNDPETYICELGYSNSSHYLKLPYDGKERDYKAKLQFPNGKIKELTYSGKSVPYVEKRYMPKGGEMKDYFGTVKEKGGYEYYFLIPIEYKKEKFKMYGVSLIISYGME